MTWESFNFFFSVGEMVGEDFVPGQRMSTANGEFIPAATIRSGQAGHFIIAGPSAQGLIYVN